MRYALYRKIHNDDTNTYEHWYMCVEFMHDRNGSYPVFTRVADCSCHVPVPDAWSRYNRKRWSCGYATAWSAVTAKPEPEIT